MQKFIGSECFLSFPTVGSGQILDSDSLSSVIQNEKNEPTD